MTQQHRNGDISPDRVDLRDTFAAAALKGLLASNPYDHAMTYVEYANESYRMADAMLRERNGAVEARETVCQHVRGTVTQHCSLNFTLTDEEREAVESAAMSLDGTHSLDYMRRARQAATLRSLLERLK
jgi:hypothetical protein